MARADADWDVLHKCVESGTKIKGKSAQAGYGGGAKKPAAKVSPPLLPHNPPSREAGAAAARSFVGGLHTYRPTGRSRAHSRHDKASPGVASP